MYRAHRGLIPDAHRGGDGEGLWGCGAGAGLAGFALGNVLYIRLHEEPKLAKRFGARYRDYCARVPRWWPVSLSLRRSEAR